MTRFRVWQFFQLQSTWRNHTTLIVNLGPTSFVNLAPNTFLCFTLNHFFLFFWNSFIVLRQTHSFVETNKINQLLSCHLNQSSHLGTELKTKMGTDIERTIYIIILLFTLFFKRLNAQVQTFKWDFTIWISAKTNCQSKWSQ